MADYLNKQINNIIESKQVYTEMLSVLSNNNIDHELYDCIFDKICLCDEKISKYNSVNNTIHNKYLHKEIKEKTEDVDINNITLLSKSDRIKNIYDEIKPFLRKFVHEDYPDTIFHITNDNLVYLTQDVKKKEFKCRYELWKKFLTIDVSPNDMLNDILENEYSVTGYYTTFHHWRTTNFSVEKFIPKISKNNLVIEQLLGETNFESSDEQYFVEKLQSMVKTRYSVIPYKIYYTIDGSLYMIENIMDKSISIKKDFCNEYQYMFDLNQQDILEKIQYYMKKHNDTEIQKMICLSHKNIISEEKEMKASFKYAEKLD